MDKRFLWQIAPYLLSLLSYVIGLMRNKFRLPGSISRLLGNRVVLDILNQGIEAARAMDGRTDEEKREYVRTWVRAELSRLTGEWLSDSTINYLIEHSIVSRKAAKAARWMRGERA